jgi:hypothetical protein
MSDSHLSEEEGEEEEEEEKSEVESWEWRRCGREACSIFVALVIVGFDLEPWHLSTRELMLLIALNSTHVALEEEGTHGKWGLIVFYCLPQKNRVLLLSTMAPEVMALKRWKTIVMISLMVKSKT